MNIIAYFFLMKNYWIYIYVIISNLGRFTIEYLRNTKG